MKPVEAVLIEHADGTFSLGRKPCLRQCAGRKSDEKDEQLEGAYHMQTRGPGYRLAALSFQSMAWSIAAR